MTARFRTGAEVSPAAATSQEPFDLLSSISSVDLALSQPRVRVYAASHRTGREDTSGRPLMRDLVEPPRFGEPLEGRNPERPLVSLEGFTVASEQQYGEQYCNNIEMTFVVHRPDEVFNAGPDSTAWRAILNEGADFVLEYGWQGASQNPLLNGQGFVGAASGVVVPSHRVLMLRVITYSFDVTAQGELRFVLKALEGAEVQLREMRLGDVLGVGDPRGNAEREMTEQESKRYSADVTRALKSRVDGLPLLPGGFVRLRHVADEVCADTIAEACSRAGYGGVDLYMGNFNRFAGRFSREYGNEAASGRSIGEFLVPIDVLRKGLSSMMAGGVDITVYNFLGTVFNIANATQARSGDDLLSGLPPLGWNLMMKTSTLPGANGGPPRFVMSVLDAIDGMHPFGPNDRLYGRDLTRERVLAKVRERRVPIVPFGHGLSYVKDVSFNVNVDEHMRNVLVDRRFTDRKDRADVGSRPGATRRGSATDGRYALMSVVEGDVTMVGNFAFDNLSLVWVDVFGVPQISGGYQVRSRTDSVSAGQFTTKVGLLATGDDPLNSRMRKTPEEVTVEALRDAWRKLRASSSAKERGGGKPGPSSADADAARERLGAPKYDPRTMGKKG